MKRAAWLLGVSVFLLNPNWACSGDSSEEQPTAVLSSAEIDASVGGKWRLTLSDAGETASFVFDLTQDSSGETTHLAPTLTSQPRQGRWASTLGSFGLIKTAAARRIRPAPIDMLASYAEGSTALGSIVLWPKANEPKTVHGSLYLTASGPNRLVLTFGDLSLTADLNLDGSVSRALTSLPAVALGPAAELVREK